MEALDGRIWSEKPEMLERKRMLAWMARFMRLLMPQVKNPVKQRSRRVHCSAPASPHLPTFPHMAVQNKRKQKCISLILAKEPSQTDRKLVCVWAMQSFVAGSHFQDNGRVEHSE